MATSEESAPFPDEAYTALRNTEPLGSDPTPPPARGEEGYAKRFSVEDQLVATKATLTATEARLAEVIQQRDEAVAIAREWDADFQRFVSEGCNVSAVKDRRARLAQIGGEG